MQGKATASERRPCFASKFCLSMRGISLRRCCQLRGKLPVELACILLEVSVTSLTFLSQLIKTGSERS